MRPGAVQPEASYTVKRLFNQLVEICLLRAAPQDLPASRALFQLTFLLALFTGTVAIVDVLGSPEKALLAQSMDLLLMLLLLRLGLGYLGHPGRLTQAATALLGTATVLNLVIMPVELLFGPQPDVGLLGQLAVLAYLLLMFWSLVVTSHILRHSFEIPMAGGFALSVAYFFFINWLVKLVFSGG